MNRYHMRIDVVEGAFRRFSETYADLGQDLTKAGRDLANIVIDAIDQHSRQDNSLPVLYPDASFIAGSLGRRTLEKPLDDVDTYLVMNAPLVTARSGYTQLPLTAKYTSLGTPLTNDPSLKEDGFISADKVVTRLAQHLRLLFPDRETGTGGKRRTCYVKVGDVNVDVTPVVWFESTIGGIDQYWMPIGNGSYAWKGTNPKEDQRLLSAANQAHNGELLQIVRLMKWWNANQNGDRLKGIHLETMIRNELAGKELFGWADTIQYLFDRLKWTVQQSCPDPTELGDPLDTSLTSDSRAKSQLSLQAASGYADSAASAAIKGNDADCLKEWRKCFPEMY